MKASPPEAPIHRDMMHTPLDVILTEMLFASRAEHMKRAAKKAVFETKDAVVVVQTFITSMREVVDELKTIGGVF